MKTLLICIIIILISVILFYKNRNNIRGYFDKEIEKISNLNYTNEEIECLIQKYVNFETSELMIMFQDEKITENKFRALQKILNDRDVNLSQNNNFS